MSFSIKRIPFGRFEAVVLENETAMHRVVFVPAFGANIISMQLHGQQLLDGFQNDVQLISNEKSKCIHLAPFPNRIKNGNYSFRGKKYQFPINKPKENNAIHGFVWNRIFKTVKENIQNDGARVTLNYEYDGSIEGYPFPFSIDYEYVLKNNGFSIEVKATNTGITDMPFGIGWHPYFTFHTPVDELKLQLSACEVLETDQQMIPTGKQKVFTSFENLNGIGAYRFDTCFQLKNTARVFETQLYHAKKRAAIILAQSESFGYLQVYIPPHRNSIAFEPMTCPANAFNSLQGLIVLSPGHFFKGNIDVSLKMF